MVSTGLCNLTQKSAVIKDRKILGSQVGIKCLLQVSDKILAQLLPKWVPRTICPVLFKKKGSLQNGAEVLQI